MHLRYIAILLILLAACSPQRASSIADAGARVSPRFLTAPAPSNVTGWNTANPDAGATFTGADFYALLPNTSCVVQRISGVNTGATNDYLFLFDETGTGAPTSFPILSMGYVTMQSTFSLDLTSPGAGSIAGRKFFNGVKIGASSTGASYTRDASAVLSVDIENN